MSITKDFDIAIAATENMPSGYVTNKNTYDSYMRNDAWDAFYSAMSAEHRRQFGDGSGGELREKNDCPPKMASFASSSRMIYLLSRDIPGFVFERQLSTVIGGKANLDGYCESSGGYTFVEAKCREPYSHKSSQSFSRNYKPFYTYLEAILPDMFSCTMEDIPETRNMNVKFFCCKKETIYFDIKQMLCHLLGVANRMLLDKKCDSPIQFIYLLYNPTDLALPEKSREEILRIYRETCEDARKYDFKQLFSCVIDFLMGEKEYTVTQEEVERLKYNFRFALCDQTDYRRYF